MGLLFTDGQPPFFERYNINSASIVFKEWDNFPNPNIRKQEIKEFKKKQYERPEFNIQEKLEFADEVENSEN